MLCEEIITICSEMIKKNNKYTPQLSHTPTWLLWCQYIFHMRTLRVIERLAAQTGYSQNYSKHSNISGNLNLSQANWNGSAEGTRRNQALLIDLVWKNGYMPVVGSPTWGGALLDVYLVQPTFSLVSCSIVLGISNHCGIIGNWLEQNLPCTTSGKISPVVWQNRCFRFANFPQDKFARWAENGSCMEEIWKNF